MKRRVELFVAVMVAGSALGGSAFAGQLNALGREVPAQTNLP